MDDQNLLSMLAQDGIDARDAMPTLHLHQEYPYLSGVTMDPRLTGFQAGLIPFLQFMSSPRVDMVASHLNQAMVIDGGSFPRIFAGPENMLGEYEFSKTRLDQDITVVAVIPKYAATLGPSRIERTPSITIVYLGHRDNKLHYMTADSYFRGSDGFGYINKWDNLNRVHAGLPIYQFNEYGNETKLVTSPAHKNGMYCLGVELNVAFMTLEETIEDAMLVSRSAADKMATTEIKEVKIQIRQDEYPLNTYGVADDIRAMPDIGERVNANGVLAAFRSMNVETLLPDTTEAALGDLQTTHDNIFYAPPGALILDITVNAIRSSKAPRSLFAQFDKYIDGNIRYWQQIVEIYSQHRQTHELSKAFHEHLTVAIQRLIAAGKDVRLPGVTRRTKVKLIGKNKLPIDFMEITVVYAIKRPFAEGFKITGRDGQKGVTCRILPDECMPTDDYGFRADLVIDPSSSINRMTIGPLYETAINRVSEFVRRKVQALHAIDPVAAVDMLFDYYNDIHPNYAKLVRETLTTEQARRAHVLDAITSGNIYLHIPPGLDNISFELINRLQKKWDVKLSPVTFTTKDMDGNVIDTFRTKNNVCIGSKYVYTLCKIPEPSSPGVAHVNQYNTPMKSPPSERNRFPIKRNPIRLGEEESRISLMDLQDAEEYMRMMCLQGSSPKGMNLIVETLLTAQHPTRIRRFPITTAELINSNTIVKVFEHMFTTMGLGVSTHGARPRLNDLLQETKF